MNDQTIRVAIVEDDRHYAAILQKYLDRYTGETGQTFHVYLFRDGTDIVENYTGIYDIILMDIEMQVLDGMTTAERIRKLDQDVVIIFITNMPQYAMKGYAVDALDFVLKPVNYYSFSQRIKRALDRMGNRRSHYLTVSIKNGILKLDVAEILYVEVQNHDLTYHTGKGDITVRGTIMEAETALAPYHFYRIGKPYLVNLAFVQGFVDGRALIQNTSLPVSRPKRRDFMDALNNYIHDVSL